GGRRPAGGRGPSRRVCRAKALRPVGEPPSCRRISTVSCSHVARRIELRLCPCWPPVARFSAAAALPRMQRDRRDAGHVVRGLLARLFLHRAALLRTLRVSVRRGSRRRRAVRRLPCPPPAL